MYPFRSCPLKRQHIYIPEYFRWEELSLIRFVQFFLLVMYEMIFNCAIFLRLTILYYGLWVVTWHIQVVKLVMMSLYKCTAKKINYPKAGHSPLNNVFPSLSAKLSDVCMCHHYCVCLTNISTKSIDLAIH